MNGSEKEQLTMTAMALTALKVEAGRKTPGYGQKLIQLTKDAQALYRALKDPNARLPDYVTICDSTDSKLMALPHPVRTMQLGRVEVNAALLLGPDLIADIFGMAQVGCNMNEVLYFIETHDSPDVRRFLDAQSVDRSTVNDGALSAIIHPIFHSFSGGGMFEISNNVVESLLSTDVSGDVPCQFMRSPMPSCYIEFGDRNVEMPLSVRNNETGDHQLQGVYIVEREVTQMSGYREAARVLGMEMNEPARIMDLMFVGRAKTSLLDDGVFHMSIYMQDDAMSVQELIERHANFYSNKDLLEYNSIVAPGFRSAPSTDDLERYAGYLRWLSKVLLYLNIADFRREVKNDRTDMASKLASLGPKKAAKQARKMLEVYDRIVIDAIRPTSFSTPSQEGYHRTTRPHFRRGHIRMQRYGEGRAQIKPVFIHPIFVNADAVGVDSPQIKPYTVK
ncbi:hypothetical protein [Aeromonas jandaei]|uniref:hypothetical protein n=1 Tax=Aeromonas jandaei TaxID=650 RepID=UPI002AA0C935|nr:hypothetical protein [Aeromonas jandaei]